MEIEGRKFVRMPRIPYLAVPPSHTAVALPSPVDPRPLVRLALRGVVLLERHGAVAVRLPVRNVAHICPVLQVKPLLVLHHLVSVTRTVSLCNLHAHLRVSSCIHDSYHVTRASAAVRLFTASALRTN